MRTATFKLVNALICLGFSGCFAPEPSPGTSETDGETADVGDTDSASGPSSGSGSGSTSDSDSGSDSDSDSGPGSESGSGPGTATDSGPDTDSGTDSDSDSDSDSESESGTETGAVDVDPPFVESFEPLDGATGVRADDEIVIRFSEPMDPDSVEGAYASADLDHDAVAFTWNAAHDRLTITPNSGFPYAEGGDPALVPALSFAFRITTDATDEAGNQLDEELEVSFSTLRRISIVLPHDSALTAGVYDGGVLNPGLLFAGDNSANMHFKGVTSFELPGAPFDGAEIESARVVADVDYFYGTPYASLGDLEMEAIAFDSTDEAWDAPVGVALGAVATATDAPIDADVTDVYTAAVTADETSLQFRIGFELDTDSDGAQDNVFFDADTLELELDVLFE